VKFSLGITHYCRDDWVRSSGIDKDVVL
jgi:hypothetical protein